MVICSSCASWQAPKIIARMEQDSIVRANCLETRAPPNGLPFSRAAFQNSHGLTREAVNCNDLFSRSGSVLELLSRFWCSRWLSAPDIQNILSYCLSCTTPFPKCIKLFVERYIPSRILLSCKFECEMQCFYCSVLIYIDEHSAIKPLYFLEQLAWLQSYRDQ